MISIAGRARVVGIAAMALGAMALGSPTMADFLFLGGVNHIFFHGTPYSPSDAPWPGWQFYAAVNFGPEGGLFHNLPYFNAYITRCQSVLQDGRSANDVLLYNPVYDVWNSGSGAISIGSPMTASFTTDGQMLFNRGYAYDNVTDRFLAKAKVVNGKVVLGGSPYTAVVIPTCHYMPLATLQNLGALARSGTTIIIQDAMPADVPGFGDLANRQSQFQALEKTLMADAPEVTRSAAGFTRVPVGKGAFLIGSNVEQMLAAAGTPREAGADLGLRFVRRTHAQGYNYFLVNHGQTPIDGWVTLGESAKSAVLLDPRQADRTGVAAVRQGADKATQVYLQLLPSESCILRTFTTRAVTGPAWSYEETAGAPQPLTGTWDVKFTDGGPNLPAPFTTPTLASWTTLGDAEAKRFAGSAVYTLTFDGPTAHADDWVLDLGQVADSARVTLNGHDVGALWCAPFTRSVGQWLQPGQNTLTVEVTNLAANRVADLDRRGVNWKIFYDANIAAKRGGKFDASNWPEMDSGLLGPVQLIPETRGVPTK
jgi:hypothetical protein